MQFFDIRTSKIAPNNSCFEHFHVHICFSPQQRAIFRHQNSELPKVFQTPHVLCIFISTCAFRHSGVHFFNIRTSKSVPNPQFFNIFTSQCAFRHSGVQLFDSRTSKSAPKMTCFVHFHFPMCVSPQRRAIFRQQNFKKCSDTVSF